jgi:hypothetical protein
MIVVRIITMSLAVAIIAGFQATPMLPRAYRTSQSLRAYDDEKSGFSLGSLAILGVGLVGVFGTGFLTTFKDVLSASKSDDNAPIIKTDAGEKNRGSKTRLTKREINNKLAQVPIFYVVKDGAIYVDDSSNEGQLFVEREDAEKLSKSKGLSVSATSLDDAFFTLVQKKTKLGAFIEGIASNANPLATYYLTPSTQQLNNVNEEWKQSHAHDIPLFRISTLAFSKEQGLEFPLFTRKEDALNAFERLQESKGKAADASAAEVQLTSILDVVQLFSTGGFEGRALEIYPSMDAVDNARTLMQLR